MVVSFGAAGSVTSGTGTTISVPYPSGITAGQRLIISAAYRHNQNRTMSTPSGWTLITHTGRVSNNHIYLFRRDAVGTESGSQTISISGSIGAHMAFMTRWTTTGTWDAVSGGNGSDVGAGSPPGAEWDVTTSGNVERVPGDRLLAFSCGNAQTYREWYNEFLDGNADPVEHANHVYTASSGGPQLRVSSLLCTQTANSPIRHVGGLGGDPGGNMAGPGSIVRLRDIVVTARRGWGSIPIKSDS